MSEAVDEALKALEVFVGEWNMCPPVPCRHRPPLAAAT